MIYTFSETNSGGRWWLNRKQYEALFAAGWKYTPSEYDLENNYDKKSLFGGDDVPYGWRHNLCLEAESIQDAVENWESATGEYFFAGGCPCCGAPFNIYSENYAESASGEYIEAPRPW